jgi:hypothetical protein
MNARWLDFSLNNAGGKGMMTTIQIADDLTSEATIYEAYFDLWGFSVNWIKAIQNQLLDFANPGDGEECEAYTCEACMAVRFRSCDVNRVRQAKALFHRLVALAKSTYSASSEVAYIRP